MAGVSPLTSQCRATIRSALLAWYDKNRRNLPWRAPPGEAAEPYRVWLSEIMLQQTTVAHATGYFLAFTSRWPTVTDLANAADEAVMAAWAGLGYYARARNLLACARVVSEAHGGVFPSTEAALRNLPGVGDYTAAAIAAIAFGREANVVDGNVERVVARLFAFEGVLPAAKLRLKALAGQLVETQRPGDWAQALMDLGSGVCRPRQPLCLTCPLLAECSAAATGEPARFPLKAPKALRPQRHGAVYVLRHRTLVALVTRPPSGLLGGMTALPTTSWDDLATSDADIERQAPANGGWRRLGAVEHVFTHFGLTLDVYDLEIVDPIAGYQWTAVATALSAMPTVFRKALLLQAAPRSARTLARKVSMDANPASVLKCQ